MTSSPASTDSTPLLEMEGIGKRFGGVVALDNVSFSVRAGEIVALIGENGAGKSTLMKILGGVHEPDAGTVRVEGAPQRIRSTRDAGRLGIGFIHQELNLLDNLDVAANLSLGREPTRGGALKLLDQKAIEERAVTALARIGLDVSPRTPLAYLSLAQRQLVEIARALSQDVRLLIMDEPTSSLTLGETQLLLALIKDLRASRGVSIVYISHRLGEIRQIADRVVALRDGKNAGTLDQEEITHDRMVRLMVGRDLTPSRARELPAAAEDRPPLLEVRALRTARHPDKTVSFTIRGGEVLGFAGLIGAGRTEVAEALFGVAPAVGGEILLDGTPVRIGAPGDAIRRGICLVPEDRRRCGLILDMAIRENVTLPSLQSFASSMGWIQAEKERTTAGEWCTRLNLRSALARQSGSDIAQVVEAHASTLSGGNQQKVVLAKWVGRQPKVLLFDEPTRGVDVGAKSEIYALIRALAAEGVAVMVISSDMEEVLGISDRIAVMHEGTLTGFLEQDELSEEAVMRLAVGGKEHA